MDILSVLKTIPMSCIKEFFTLRFIPSENDMTKISKYLIETRKELKNKNASIMEQKLTLYTIPYLKYLELSQIDNWEQKYCKDINLLFDLYIAQGIWHKGIRRIIWNENESIYYCVNSFPLNNKANTQRNITSNNKWLIRIFLIFLTITCFLISLNFGLNILNYFCTFIFIFLSILIVFMMYRDLIVISSTNRIMNKYPDLIRTTK